MEAVVPIRFATVVRFAALPFVLAAVAVVASSASGGGGGGTTYFPGTPALAQITNGTAAAPWNLFQGDGPLNPFAVYPGATSGTDGDSPYPSGTVGSPGPLAGYCGSGANAAAAAGTPVRMPDGTTLPLAPAYFPHVVRNADGSLTGYFDYRPKDADEAIVAATSTDDGATWTYQGEALEQNPGYCPNSDINDDGQGHPNVITVGGVSRLYTLQRAAGDNVGVGMLVHTLTSTSANPLAGLPATEKVGVDPNDFASGPVSVGSTPVTINFTNPVNSGPEALVAGPFVDLTQTPAPTASSIITCTSVGAQSLGGCTTAATGGINVQAGDLIEQVLATISSDLPAAAPGTACGSGTLPCNVPPGPNTTTGDGGLTGFGLAVTNPNNLSLAILNADAPNRAYIDGVAVYCNQANAFPTNKIESCTTGPNGPTLTVHAGDPLTSDPIVPATAQQTSGLVAPDGIVGVLPTYPGAPVGSTVVMYTEKVLNYYDVGFTGGKAPIGPGSGDVITSTGKLSFTPFPSSLAAPINAGANTFFIGDSTTNTIVQVNCTGFTPPTTLTGCTAPGVTASDQVSKNSYIAAAGATTVPPSTLAQIGLGSAKNTQKLFKNNEDLTVLRVAYTTDGINFSTAGLANNGVISGNGTESGSSYDDLSNPSSTASPSSFNAYATPGTALATEMRFIGAAGTIVANPDGSYGLFLSGAWPTDGDSDAFDEIFYSSSSDGQHWTVPTTVVSTDYTFAASATPSSPLGVGAYYSGRAYGPSIVQNPDGTLTMVFAGYRLPSPAGTVGATYGTNSSSQYTIGANDPLLYRQILTDTLTSSTSPAVPTTTAVAATPPAAVTGQPVQLTATVTVNAPGVGTPTGTVSFTDELGPIPGCANRPLSDTATDTATCTTAFLAASHTVRATYSGDSNYATSNGQVPAPVAPATTATALGSSSSSVVSGAPVTYTATVSVVAPGVGTPTGTVSFTDGGNPILGCTSVPVTADVAVCPTIAGDTGSHAIAATYSGDSNFGSSTGNLAQAVGLGGTTTTLVSGPTSAVTGQQVAYTATVAIVSPATGTPTGTVAFTDGGQPLAGCDAVALTAPAPFTATCLVAPTTVGDHKIVASYSGSSNFGASSDHLTETVAPAATTTALQSSVSSPVFGQQVNLTATISVNAPGAGTPTGTVSFTDGGQPVPACQNLPVGTTLTAVCAVTPGAAGNHGFAAAYSGDAGFATSTGQLTVTVAPANTTTGLQSSLASPVPGQPVTLTATLSVNVPGAGTPTGTVAFADGGNPIATCGAVPVAGGTAVCATSFATAASHDLTAVYSGDGSFNGSNGELPQTVQQATTTTSVTPSSTSLTYGDHVVYTATVVASAPAVITPGGTVSFTDNGTPIAGCTAVTLTSVATCSTTIASAGAHHVVATYGGDANDNGSKGSLDEAAAKATLTVTANDATRLFGKPNPPLTATITGFLLGDSASVVNGSPSCTTTAAVTSPSGFYPITCGNGTLSAANYTFTFVPGTLTVTYSKTIVGDVKGPTVIAAGQVVAILGAHLHGPLTIQPGALVDIEAATVDGPVRADAPAAFRLCGSTVSGPLDVEQATGPVVVGNPPGCPGNTVSGPVKVDGGVDATVTGNGISGPLEVLKNTGTVVDRPNTVQGPAKLQ
ncbi:MAG: Ig-like domain repeat protein [Actinobacteria bacterium]|nr:Ig-like domain repeat protein [Actinomycetota bacterium]